MCHIYFFQKCFIENLKVVYDEAFEIYHMDIFIYKSNPKNLRAILVNIGPEICTY